MRLSGDVTRELQARLEHAVSPNHGRGGGVLRLEGPGGVLWEGAAGQVHQGGEPMRPGDTFEIASVTKTFTATVVLQLCEEGKLALDGPIGDHLPPAVTHGLLVIVRHDYGAELTVRQLLQHTSGLPDFWSDHDEANAFLPAFLAAPDRFFSPDDVLAYVRKLRPAGPPGKRYHYSDTGYVLLGKLVESVEDKKLHEVFRARLLGPLGMNDTYFSYREPKATSLPEAHRYEGTQDLHGQRRQTADWASGGLVSSTRDLSRFALALARGELFRSPATLEQMRTWAPIGKRDLSYGLGLFRIRLDAPAGHLEGHDGHGNAFMYVLPERGLAIVGTLDQTENDWWPLVEHALKTVSADLGWQNAAP
jgi:D-alanyl-D-alanine carboxypeptidase